MQPTAFSYAVAALLVVAAIAEEGPQPLLNPLPDAIPQGDIVVAAVPFVRAPQTVDPAKPVGTNDAYARIQYLMPIQDGSRRLVFNDLRGFLYVTDLSGRDPVVYLDLNTQDVGVYNAAYPNETGLLGFAFHPQFADEGKPGYAKFYTGFTAVSAGFGSNLADDAIRQLMFYVSGREQADVIREWTATDPDADVFEGASREIFRNAQFATTHNIGTIAFNPFASEDSSDYGLLYASIGDGGSANDPEDNGQDLATPLGAILRIDPLSGGGDRAYGIPADNPFVDRAGAAPEIWAYGIRHAQHFSWDEDGRMFINDIGQDQVEEINLGVAGGNYGWRLREGTFATAFGVGAFEIGSVFPAPPTEEEPFLYPVAQYDHDEGYAIGSGFVYRGAGIPSLQGRYVFADITRGRIFSIATDALRPGHPTPIEELRLTFDGEERALLDLVGFGNTYHGGVRADLRLGLDAAGELYLLTKGDGWIRKLVAMPGS